MSNIVNLDLSDYNKDGAQRMANIRYDGGDLLEDQTRLWANKFTLTTQAYPLHIPELSTQWTPFYPQGANSGNTTVATIPNNKDYYFTDFVITVQVGSNYYTAPVRWEKDGYKLPLPMNINSPYFWVKSAAFLCDIITSAFDLATSPGSFIFIKQASNWTVAALKQYVGTNEVKIYFNDAMKRYFNFNYQEDGGFLIKSYISSMISGAEYFVTTTDSTNTLLFPFDRLVFVSSKLPVPPLFYQENNTSVINMTKDIILSYDLIITDISMLGNTISFVTENSDRSLSLTGNGESILNPFSLSAFFVARDNTMFQVRLNPGDKLAISFSFY